MPVAYLMSRFPKLTETFVLDEILELERQGVAVEIFPLLRTRQTNIYFDGIGLTNKILERLAPARGKPLVHPDAAELVERAHFSPFLSWQIVRANLAYFGSQPARYVKTFVRTLRDALGSLNLFLGAAAYFPKCVFWAYEMQRLNIEQMHAHFANHPTTAALVIHRLTGIPYTFTAHGTDLHVDQHMLRSKVQAAAAVITISNYNREFILDHCGQEFQDKVHVVHVGVNTERFSPIQQPEHAPDPHFKILCVGTLHPLKGQRWLIRACRLLRERGVAFRCTFVGEGQDRQALQHETEAAGLDDAITFAGARTRQEVLALMQRANVLVSPSVPTPDGRREGIPVVLMEAMACGLPVVASRLSGIPELIESQINGLLVPPADAEPLADALGALAASPALQTRLGKAGRERVLNDFCLSKTALRIIALHRQVALEPSPVSHARPSPARVLGTGLLLIIGVLALGIVLNRGLLEAFHRNRGNLLLTAVPDQVPLNMPAPLQTTILRELRAGGARGVLDRGMLDLAAGNCDRAIGEFRAFTSVRDDPLAPYWLGRCYGETGNWAAAIKAWQTAGLGFQLTKAGDSFSEQQNWRLADLAYRATLDLEPGNCIVRARAISAEWWMQRDIQNATAQIREALPGCSKPFELELVMGQILLEEKQYDAAQDWLVRARTANPASDVPLTALGLLYLRRDQAAQALPLLQAASRLAPQKGNTFALLGSTFARLGEPPEAIHAYKMAIGLGTRAGWVYEGLGTMYEMANDPVLARAAYTRALELDASLSTSRVRLARLPAK